MVFGVVAGHPGFTFRGSVGGLLTLPLGRVLSLGVDPDESGGQHRDAVLADLMAAMVLSPLFLRFPHRPSTRHKADGTLLKQRHWGQGNRRQ